MLLPHLPGYDGMHRGASVAHHEYKFGVREEFQNIRAHLEGERVLVAQPRRRLGVSCYYLQAEGRYRAVYHLQKMYTFGYFKVSSHRGSASLPSIFLLHTFGRDKCVLSNNVNLPVPG